MAEMIAQIAGCPGNRKSKSRGRNKTSVHASPTAEINAAKPTIHRDRGCICQERQHTVPMARRFQITRLIKYWVNSRIRTASNASTLSSRNVRPTASFDSTFDNSIATFDARTVAPTTTKTCFRGMATGVTSCLDAVDDDSLTWCHVNCRNSKHVPVVFHLLSNNPAPRWH